MTDKQTTTSYKASINSEGRWYADGPGDGFGYHAGWLYPSFTFDTQQEAERVTRMLDNAYAAGYRAARLEIQRVLGIA